MTLATVARTEIPESGSAAAVGELCTDAMQNFQYLNGALINW